MSHARLPLGSNAPQDGVAPQASAFFLLAITVALLPHLWFQPVPFALAIVSLLASRWWLWRHRAPDFNRWLTGVLALAVVAGVAVWYQTLIGAEPGVAMLTTLTALKTHELRARRDQVVIIALGLFSATALFLSSQDPWALGTALISTVLLVAALRELHRGPTERSTWRYAREAGVLCLQTLPLAAVIFLLFPRFPGVGLTTADRLSGRTGLSESMSPGDVGRLTESDRTAMTVYFEGPIPAESDLYFRGPVLDRFDGRTWHTSPNRRYESAPKAFEVSQDSRPIRYTADVEPHAHPWLFGLETTTEHGAASGETLMDADLTLHFDEPIVERTRYEGIAWLHARTAGPATHDGKAMGQWLETPPGFNPRTRQWLQTLQADVRQDAPQRDIELMNRVLHHLSSGGYRYTLSPPKLGQHTVDELLFDTRAGFCEHYSSAFVFSMRALGIPARVVTGYLGGEPNAQGGAWRVRQKDAHAWAEVWIAPQGWTRVDPTSHVAPERLAQGAQWIDSALGHEKRWLQTWLSASWQRWMTGFNYEQQRKLLQALGLKIEGAMEGGLLFVGVVLALTLLMVLGARWRLHRPLPQEASQAEYLRWCRRVARKTQLARLAHESPAEYSRRLSAARPAHRRCFIEIAQTYNELRYNPDAETLALRQRLKALCAMPLPE